MRDSPAALMKQDLQLREKFTVRHRWFTYESVACAPFLCYTHIGSEWIGYENIVVKAGLHIHGIDRHRGGI